MDPQPMLALPRPHRPHHRVRGVVTAVLGLLALTMGALIAPPASAVTPGGAVRVAAPWVATQRMASFDAQMLSLINGARAGTGVPALHQAGGLTSLAVWWSAKMASGATGYQLEHNPNAWTMVTQYGASNRTAWAENVAAFSASASAQAVFNAYMNSPPHRANILSGTYRYIGVGTVSGSKGAFNTMEFTDKVDGAPAAPTTKPAPAPKPSPKPTPTPAPKPSPTPKPAPPTRSHPAPTTSRSTTSQRATTARSSARAPQASRPETARPASVPAVHGAVMASFGALPAAGITFSIRERSCRGELSATTTGRDGRAPVTAKPGEYCAVAVSAPHGIQLPRPVRFTVRSGHAFTVAMDNVQPVPVVWRARPLWLLRPV